MGCHGQGEIDDVIWVVRIFTGRLDLQSIEGIRIFIVRLSQNPALTILTW